MKDGKFPKSLSMTTSTTAVQMIIPTTKFLMEMTPAPDVLTSAKGVLHQGLNVNCTQTVDLLILHPATTKI